MSSNVEIANRALQHLGAKRITSLTEDSRNAQSINACFEPIKLALLRKHVWGFAVARASLAANATDPLFTRDYSYPLPSDFVRLAAKDPEDVTNMLDWQIEGRNIFTNDAAPLEIRYVYNVTDPNEMDPLFRELFAAELAAATCEDITQSNGKLAAVKDVKNELMAEARRVNAIEMVAEKPPEDDWVTCRT